MKTQLLVLLLGLPLLFFSCTVQKRVHRPGYHVEWKKRQVASQQEETTAVRPDVEQAALSREPTLASVENTEVAANEPVLIAETVVSVEEKTQPEEMPGVQEQRPDRAFPLNLTLPKTEKRLQQDDRQQTSMSQSDSRNRAGLLLAPIKLLFTIVLIALVIVGVVLLFVLESALGGTVLLAAGAVLLILILL